MKSLLIDGIKLNFIDINESAEKSILFIHGNSHSHRTFSKQFDSQLLKDYRLISVDLPGHGESSKNGNYSLKSFAQILGELIKTLDLKNVIVAGHSLGGHVGINLLRYADLSGLFIFGTPPLRNPFDPDAFKANPNTKAMAQTHSTTHEIELFMSEMKYENEFLTSGVEDYLKTDPDFRVNIFTDIIAGTHENEISLIKSFPGEMLILLATTDGLINNNYIRNELDTVEMIELDSGHSPHIEKSSEFNQVLADFSKKVFSKNLISNKIRIQHESSYEQRNQ